VCLLGTLASLLLISACQKRTNSALAGTNLVGRYIALAVELGERDPDSLDYAINSDHLLEKFKSNPESFDGLHRSAVELSREVHTLPPDDRTFTASRKELLMAQTEAIALRIEQLMGRNRPFDEESRTLFGVVAQPDNDEDQRKTIRRKLARLIGSSDDSAAAYSRYDAQFNVPPDRIPAVMNMALQQCRALTLEHLSLPAEEHVDVRYVSHKPWSAFSQYLGNSHSIIQVNTDYPLTVNRILDLACHEGYPGHHALNTMRDKSVVQAEHLDEFRVQLTFSPQSYVSEAAASYAPSLVLSNAERLHIERDLLFPLAGLKNLDAQRYLAVQQLVAALHTAEPSIARDYLDGRLEFVRAADALERETLMQHSETTLLYLNEYRTYMLCYTLGADTVKSIIEAGHPTNEERWHRYRNLMVNPVVSLTASSN
jgi:hypothetical protein